MPKSLLVKMGLVFLISGAVTATTTVKMEATKEKNVVVMLHFYFRLYFRFRFFGFWIIIFVALPLEAFWVSMVDTQPNKVLKSHANFVVFLSKCMYAHDLEVKHT